MDIKEQFPTMLHRKGGGEAYYISNKSWRVSARLSGKIFQERCVVQPNERVPQSRRNTTRVKTRPISVGDSSVVDWFTGKEFVVVTQPDVPTHYTTNQTSMYILSNRSWRLSARISGKIFQERCIYEVGYRLSIRPRVVVSQITLDDERVVNYLEEENTFNPSAIQMFPTSKQEIDITKYYHEERAVGIGSGNVKDRRPKNMGIDMTCDAIGWQGRKHYTDDQFFRWKKPATLKAKEMKREDFNVYQRILRTQREQRPLPK